MNFFPETATYFIFVMVSFVTNFLTLLAKVFCSSCERCEWWLICQKLRALKALIVCPFQNCVFIKTTTQNYLAFLSNFKGATIIYVPLGLFMHDRVLGKCCKFRDNASQSLTFIKKINFSPKNCQLKKTPMQCVDGSIKDLEFSSAFSWFFKQMQPNFWLCFSFLKDFWGQGHLFATGVILLLRFTQEKNLCQKSRQEAWRKSLGMLN